ncbi:hypothetical protein AAF712_013248 [Marasmius tenuissimus]|uniref:Uncharacterized protein n=1 Tax=Marasmius tenuissimus TaxID=585030 RepID=A0ABR2ZFF4_9AGAR
MTAVATLNIRGTRTSHSPEELETVKESQRNGALGSQVAVSDPTPAVERDDPFIKYINSLQYPAPRLNTNPVKARQPGREASGREDEEREHPTEQGNSNQHVPLTIAVQNETPAPTTMSTNEDLKLLSSDGADSQTKKTKVDGQEEFRGVGDTQPKIIRQLPRVPSPRGGGEGEGGEQE